MNHINWKLLHWKLETFSYLMIPDMGLLALA